MLSVVEDIVKLSSMSLSNDGLVPFDIHEHCSKTFRVLKINIALLDIKVH